MNKLKEIDIKMEIKIGGIKFKNPIMTASGTFGSGEEYAEFVDLNQLGAVVTKGVAIHPWPGNPTPRIAETPSGMLNAIGLQNPGVDQFMEKDLLLLSKYNTKIIVNVVGKSVEEYCEAVERLSDSIADLLEINISCPNVKEGGIAFGQNPSSVEYITREIKKISKKPIIMKLSPNVTDIRETAKAAQAGGADAISLINTLTGMKIDVHRRQFALANKTGGLSGPAIHPIAVRMVYEAYKVVTIPIIGMGGVMSGEDAIELMMAGATGVAVGTANFHQLTSTLDILKGIEEYLNKYQINDIRELIGCMQESEE